MLFVWMKVFVFEKLGFVGFVLLKFGVGGFEGCWVWIFGFWCCIFGYGFVCGVVLVWGFFGFFGVVCVFCFCLFCCEFCVFGFLGSDVEFGVLCGWGIFKRWLGVWGLVFWVWCVLGDGGVCCFGWLEFGDLYWFLWVWDLVFWVVFFWCFGLWCLVFLWLGVEGFFLEGSFFVFFDCDVCLVFDLLNVLLDWSCCGDVCLR